MTDARLSILGFGLLGASVARAARKNIPNCQITVYDRDPAAFSADLGGRVVDEFRSDAGEACRGASFIILCIPPASVASLFEAIRNDVPTDAVVTDVSSVKRSVVAHAQSILTSPHRFLGSHPMAGGERSGSAASRADLFESSTVVVTPIDSTDAEAFSAVETFWQRLGAQTLRMSPEAHDRAVAEISHVPHALASILMHASDPASRAIAGPGFRDMTRVASGDATLWQEILSDNADEVRQVIHRVRAQLAHLDSLLDPTKAEELRQWLRAAAEARRLLVNESKS